MLITISPAKKLDPGAPHVDMDWSQPELLDESQRLIERMRDFSPPGLQELMHISEKLAGENHRRFQDWHMPFTPDNAKAALMLFQGDVYMGIDAPSYDENDLKYAQQHLRILSGLYGALRPLDLIQPYRLEMGTRLPNERGRNLYEFWGERITDSLNQALKAQKDDVLINLASNEYFKSVKPKALNGRIITPTFKENKNGGYRVVGTIAKKLRGLMTSFILKNRLKDPEAVKDFALNGYGFNPSLSSEAEWVFTRA